MRLIRYTKRFWQIPGFEKLLFIKSLFLSFLVHLLVHFVPLKHYIFILKTAPKYIRPEYGRQILIKIALKSFKRASLILPFQCNCMVKSITMKLLLNTLGINSKITLSVTRTNDSLLNAHAFLKIDNSKNYLESRRFHEVCTIQ
jgi:hypothetical protein